MNAGSACVSSVMRLVESIKTAHSLDVTFDQQGLGLWSYVLCAFVSYPHLFANKNPTRRYAEVASGIICGCLPVAPKFFRHSKLVLNTRLGSYFQSRSPGSTCSASSDAANLKKPLGLLHDNAHHPHSRKDNYIELNNAPGVSTVVSGGTHISSLGTLNLECHRADDHEDLENASPGNGIRKTVRVEAWDQVDTGRVR